MNFVSTNGKSPAVTFEEAVLRGTAPDGGLYVPEKIPPLPPRYCQSFSGESLHEVGLDVLSLFIKDISSEDLAEIINRAWDFPTPVSRLDKNLFLLELFHGPTLAFKDVGARFMAGVLSYFLARDDKRATILTATSGDTGSAVAHGFFGAPNVDVVILYPSGLVSRLQEHQMTTLGGNVRALEVSGTFDDCQRLVKKALADQDIRASRLLTSANSINLARLLPQITYYVWGAIQWMKGFSENEIPDLVVPSGNFGNLTAALYARKMGARLGRVLAATNVNDVVPDYLTSGVYSPRASVRTLSNAMDVGDPGNFSRIQFLCGNDVSAMRKEIDAARITDDETLSEMRRTHERSGIVIDPHTAVAVAAARSRVPAIHPCIIAATGHPAKFPEIVRKATGIDIPLSASLRESLGKAKLSIRMPNEYEELKRLLIN